MRAFWSIFLMMGLLVTLLSIHERRKTTVDKGSAIAADDGSGYPNPNPTPRPQ